MVIPPLDRHLEAATDVRPRLKPHLTLVPHSANRVELRHGVWNATSITLSDETESGRLYDIVSRLDGSLTTGEIATETGASREEVEQLLDHLLQGGLMQTGPQSALDHYLLNGLAWGATAQRGAVRPALVLGDDPDLAGTLHGLLAASLPDDDVTLADADEPAWRSLGGPDTGWLDDGLTFEERLGAYETWRGRLLVIASRAIDPVRLRAVNRVCLALGVPWLHAALDGPFALIGPLVVPGRSACYECLETRVTMNLRESASYVDYKRRLVEGEVRNGGLPLLPAVNGLVAAHAALEAVNFAVTGSSFTVGKLLAIHLPTMEINFSEVLRVPRCAGCGPVSARDATELYFDAAALLEG